MGGEVVVPLPHSEDFEKRAQHIADVIAECAEFMHVQPCDLSRPDFVKYTKIACPTSHNDLARDMALLGGFEAIRATYYPPQATDRATTLFQIRKHAALNRRSLAKVISDDEHFKEIKEWAEKVFAKRDAPKAPAILKRGHDDPPEAVQLLVMGDQHVGADIRGMETGGPDYGPVEESRSHAQCASRILDWRPARRKKTPLYLLDLGDSIEGKIHDKQASAAISDQFKRALWLKVAMVELLAREFQSLYIPCVSGNHDRNVERHPQKATSAKWDSYATEIYFAAAMATQHLPNVKWDIPKSAFVKFSIYGANYFITHGDTELEPGDPGTVIQTHRLEAQANRMNAPLAVEDKISVFIVGHCHTAAWVQLGGGAQIFTNGPMTPVNTFAHSIARYHGHSSQYMAESVPGRPVGYRCPIDIDERVYRDASLDALIPTFKGL
jgi:predicted phosphodiesterase